MYCALHIHTYTQFLSFFVSFFVSFFLHRRCFSPTGQNMSLRLDQVPYISRSLTMMYNILQHTATHCNTLQHTATHCNTLQHTATHCNTRQHTATHGNTRQHTATHCNTPQPMHDNLATPYISRSLTVTYGTSTREVSR